MSLTPELEQYYTNYFDLFNTEGWKQLIKELSSNADQINSVEHTKDEQDLYVRKGQLLVIANLINLESVINNAWDEIKENDQGIWLSLF